MSTDNLIQQATETIAKLCINPLLKDKPSYRDEIYTVLQTTGDKVYDIVKNDSNVNWNTEEEFHSCLPEDYIDHTEFNNLISRHSFGPWENSDMVFELIWEYCTDKVYPVVNKFIYEYSKLKSTCTTDEKLSKLKRKEQVAKEVRKTIDEIKYLQQYLKELQREVSQESESD